MQPMSRHETQGHFEFRFVIGDSSSRYRSRSSRVEMTMGYVDVGAMKRDLVDKGRAPGVQ